MSIRPAIHDETTKISENTREMYPSDGLLSEYSRQLKLSEKGEQDKKPSWKDKSVHGMYLPQIKEVADIEKIWSATGEDYIG